MPDLLEPPTIKRIIGRPFPPGNPYAHKAALASVAARAAKRALAPDQPQPKRTATPSEAPLAVQAAIKQQLHLVQEQITRTRSVLNDDHAEWCEECERGGIQPHHRAQLLKALDSLLERQAQLLGVPRWGMSKAERPRQSRTSYANLAQAMDLEPAPVPSACGVSPATNASQPPATAVPDDTSDVSI